LLATGDVLLAFLALLAVLHLEGMSEHLAMGGRHQLFDQFAAVLLAELDQEVTQHTAMLQFPLLILLEQRFQHWR
jgi:hypothetical protein